MAKDAGSRVPLSRVNALIYFFFHSFNARRLATMRRRLVRFFSRDLSGFESSNFDDAISFATPTRGRQKNRSV